MIVLINSSKTMGQVAMHPGSQVPALQDQAEALAQAVGQLSIDQLMRLMHISHPLAEKTKQLYVDWQTNTPTTAALDAFQGDIFRGLRASTFTNAERERANHHLKILSGLYGILQPFDAIKPYRLELLYNLSVGTNKNLYDFWGDLVAQQLPPKEPIIQLASQEYYRLLEPYVDPERVITPQFMTQLPSATEPSFVTVHAKVTRGVFARWIITQQVDTIDQIKHFAELGYQFSTKHSTPKEPLFITTKAIKPTELR
jgi:cytoplasmic iron level regulating protein YaaA (DUF328/UPF0246 family)